MDARAFQQQYDLAVRKLDAFLFKVSDGVSLQESDTFEVVLSTLHCALYIREQAKKENQLFDSNEKKLISNEWFQQVNEGLVERFMSLTWSGNPFCQRLALNIFYDLLHVDLVRWIEGCTRFMPGLLQNSNPVTVYYALNFGLIRYLFVLESYIKKNCSTILRTESLEVFTRILFAFVEEIQKLLIGSQLIKDAEPVIDTKIFNIANDSYTVSINRLISSNLGVKIIKQICIFLKRTIFLQRFLMDHFTKNYNSLVISCLNTMIYLLVYPLGAQKTTHYIIIIEALCDIMLMKTVQIQVLTSCLKTFGFLCLCASLPYNGPESYSLNNFVSKKHSQNAPMVIEMLRDWIFFFENKTKNKKRSIIEFCSSANRRNPLRVVMGLQIMKLLASSNTKHDLLLDPFLFQCMSLLSYMVSSTFSSISSLRNQAERLYISGLFKTSILDVTIPVNTVALSTSECHDQSICFDEGEGLTEQFGLPCEKKNIDVVAWLTSVKSHEDVVELIMKNFLKKVDCSNGSYVDQMPSLDNNPSHITHVNDTNLVVATPSQAPLAEGLESPENALQASLCQLKFTVIQELKSLYEEEQYQPSSANEINIDQPSLNTVDLNILLDTILTSPTTEKMLIRTPVSFIKKHQEALAAVHFQNILEKNVFQKQNQLSLPATVDYCIMESKLFNQFKSQVLQKLLLQHEINKDQQTRFFLSYMKYVWKLAIEQSFTQYWESCLAVSIETLFTKYVHCLREYRNNKENHSSNKSCEIVYLENSKSFNRVNLFGLPFDFLNDAYHINLLAPKENETEETIKALSYEEIFKLILQFTLLIPFNKIGLDFSLKSSITKLSSLNEQNLKCIVRLFLELPYVPSYAFQVLYEFSLMDHQLRKITFAILFKYLRSTERPTLKKRTAYQLILHLACVQQCDVRQDVLTFINRQIINNPSSLGHLHGSDDTKKKFQDEWSNIHATTIWLDFFAISLLRYTIEEFAIVIRNPNINLYSDTSWHIMDVTPLNQHLKMMCEHYFRPLIRSQVADIVAERNRVIDIIQRFGSLLSLLCYHRSHLLGILMNAYGLATCINPILTEALQQLFFETLQCIPKEQLSVLIPLIHPQDTRFVPLYIDILTILVDSLCEPSAGVTITISEVLNVGMLAYKYTQCIQLIVPLLPCLPKFEAEHFFKQCILSSDKQCASLSIQRLLLYASKKDSFSECVSLIPCDRILYILCQSGEEISDLSSLSFSYILHALDICVTIARQQPSIFPPPIFLTFLGELVDQFSHSNGRNKLPRIFGYLLVSITQKLPSLRNSILSDIFPFLFKSYSNDPHCNIWNDSVNWEGVCDSILYFWNSTSSNIGDDPISNNSKRQIHQFLSQLPRVPLKYLLHKTNISLSA